MMRRNGTNSRFSIRSFFRRNKSATSRGENLPITLFEERFELGNQIGRGNFSIVRAGRDRTTDEKVAVKCLSKSKLNQADREAIKQEVDILQSLDHPHIIRLYGMFEDEDFFYVVTELVEGGELFDRIVKKEYYSEEDASTVIRTLAETIAYCNENGVVHRDLKPENILLVDSHNDASIKLADFGFAKEIAPNGLRTACGTPGYVAPEIISGLSYGKQVDMWSLGVITYILLCGYPPFYDENQAKLFRKIKLGHYQFEPEFWDQVSDEAKDLIKGLLVVDSRDRFTVEDVLNHPWVKNGGGGEKDITPALAELRRYQLRRRLKLAFRGVGFIEGLRADAARSRALQGLSIPEEEEDPAN